MVRTIFTFFLLGLSFGAGPCLASCGPILISYIAGTKKNTLKALTVYALFSLARISVYLILSLVVFFLGKFVLERLLSGYSRYIFIVGGSFVIFLGIIMAIGRNSRLKFCQVLEKNILEHDKKSIFALGLVIGLAPCAPLLAVLSYITLVSKTWMQSLSYGFSFGIGTFISPLLALAVLSGLIPKLFLGQKEIYNRIFSLICGLIIIFLGFQLIARAF